MEAGVLGFYGASSYLGGPREKGMVAFLRTCFSPASSGTPLLLLQLSHFTAKCSILSQPNPGFQLPPGLWIANVSFPGPKAKSFLFPWIAGLEIVRV